MNNILLKSFDWSNKLKEINSRKITEVAVFLSSFDKKERDNFYRLLLKSMVRTIPFVHLRDDVTKEEIKFFIDRFKTGYFNIHEDHFKKLDQWQGYWDKLYLEMNFNDEIAKDVKVKKIGGVLAEERKKRLMSFLKKLNQKLPATTLTVTIL